MAKPSEPCGTFVGRKSAGLREHEGPRSSRLGPFAVGQYVAQIAYAVMEPLVASAELLVRTTPLATQLLPLG